MRSKPYKRRIGQLLWIARSSRPDIAYQVNALARVAHNPAKTHWDASTHVIRYLSHTRDMGIVYRTPKTLPTGPTIWSDATWAPDYGDWYDNYASTSGSCVSADPDGADLLVFNSTKQSTVALSSAESEWAAATESAKDAAYIINLFRDLNMHCQLPLMLNCDNQSAIKQSVRSFDQKRSRHVGMRMHYLRSQCHRGKISMQWVPTNLQLCDIFTKLLPMPQHELLRTKMGVLRVSQVVAE
jgi:hypothetical protein